MTLEDFITEIMGEPKHVSSKTLDDYPEYTLADPCPDPIPHDGKAWWSE